MKLLRAGIGMLKYAFIFLIDSLLILAVRSAKSSGVVLVRLDAIGDFVLWLDAAQATADLYRSQGRRIVLVANAVWAGWANELGLFDEVIALDKRKFGTSPVYRCRFLYQLRRLGCAIAVQPTYSREWSLGDAIVRASGAVERIGFAGDNSNSSFWQQKIANLWYTRLISTDRAPRMELIRNAEFVRGLGASDFSAKIPSLHMLAPNTAQQPYYGLFVGAGWAGRRWPVARFAQLADLIYRKTHWHGIVLGGPEDVKLAETLCRESNAPLQSLAGKTSLSGLASIVSTAQLLIANETSATHIAAACGVPTVCILGGGHYGRFVPYEVEEKDDRPLPRPVSHVMPCFGCNWNCIYEHPAGSAVPCIDQIPVARVWLEIEEILRADSNQKPSRTRLLV